MIAASAALTLEFIASDIVNLNGRFELAFRYPSITCCVFASLNFRTVAGPNVLIRSQAAKGETEIKMNSQAEELNPEARDIDPAPISPKHAE